MAPCAASQPLLGDLSLAEAAAEAWASCGPAGGILPEARLSALLPAVATRLPGGGSPEQLRRLARLLRTGRPGEQLHFPGFWRAFAEAARAGVAEAEAAPVAAPACGALAMELDDFRDEVLRLLEGATSRAGACSVPTAAFAQLVQRATAASVVPKFWRSFVASGAVQDGRKELGFGDVSLAVLSCLRSALAFELGAAGGTPGPALPWQWLVAQVGRGGAAAKEALLAEDSPAKIGPSGALADQGPGLPVHLNIYDVSHQGAVQWLNSVFAHWLAPVKLGAFHAGVEVHGFEWSFGATRRETLPGISCVLPRSDKQHHFRQTVYLGCTQLSMESVVATISDLVEDYPGSAYDLLRRNCCHFAEDFCRRLGVGPIPSWVHRLARLGAGADGAMQALLGTSAAGLLPASSLRSFASELPACLASAEPVACGGAGGPGPL